MFSETVKTNLQNNGFDSDGIYNTLMNDQCINPTKPTTFCNRIHYLVTGENLEKKKIYDILNESQPETVGQLRDRYWGLKRISLIEEPDSFFGRLSILPSNGIVKMFYCVAAAVYWIACSLFGFEKNEINLDLIADVNKKSVQIGVCEHEQVRAVIDRCNEIHHYRVFFYLADGDKGAAFRDLPYAKITTMWKKPDQDDNYIDYVNEGDANWSKNHLNTVSNPACYLATTSCEEEGLDPAVYKKLFQVVLETSLRSPEVSWVKFNVNTPISSPNSLNFMPVCGGLEPRNLTKYQIENTIRLPGNNKLWMELIRENPILSGEGPVIPYFLDVAPACMKKEG